MKKRKCCIVAVDYTQSDNMSNVIKKKRRLYLERELQKFKNK